MGSGGTRPACTTTPRSRWLMGSTGPRESTGRGEPTGSLAWISTTLAI